MIHNERLRDAAFFRFIHHSRLDYPNETAFFRNDCTELTENKTHKQS